MSESGVEMEERVGEVRLMAMRFTPDELGGSWQPVAHDGTEWPWADGWDSAITAREIEDLARALPLVLNDRGEAVVYKLRHAFEARPKDSSHAT